MDFELREKGRVLEEWWGTKWSWILVEVVLGVVCME